MNRRNTIAPTTIALLCLALALPTGNAVAQQKQQVSFKVPAENSKYALQQNVDVADVPNHIARVYDVHRTFPNSPPVIGGFKVVEASDQGIADYIDGNGGSTFYSVYVMDNGDKFFARSSLTVQRASGGKLTGLSAGHITGGTGKFASMQGIIRGSVNFDPKTGFNESQVEIEYSLGK